MIYVTEGPEVDLIEPFPISEIRRLVGWSHCFRSMCVMDDAPKDEQSLIEYFTKYLPMVRSFGVIDKFNKLGYKHEAPLIGCFIYEKPLNMPNGYVHVTSTRKAWGSGLLDQAAKLGIKMLFDTDPNLLRISALLVTSNAPAKQFVKRVGFKQDGQFKNYLTQNGTPKAVSHFGILKEQVTSWTLNEKEIADVESNNRKPVSD